MTPEADVPVAVGAALVLTLAAGVKVVAVPGSVIVAAVVPMVALVAMEAKKPAVDKSVAVESDVADASVHSNVAVGLFAVGMSA